MSEISINIKEWKTSFTNIPAKYLHFASNTQLQPVISQCFVGNTVEFMHDQCSRKLYQL